MLTRLSKFPSESSARINQTRLVKMDARNKCMRKIFGEAQYKIYEKIHTDRVYYRDLLEKLLAQVLRSFQLSEP